MTKPFYILSQFGLLIFFSLQLHYVLMAYGLLLIWRNLMLISFLECKKNVGKEKESPKKETEKEFFQEKRSNGSCTASYIFSLSEVKLSFLYFIKDLCFDKNWIIFPILLPFSQRNITFLILCFLFAILFSIFLTV